jgi:DNA-binding NarL/FixJ family response regulator
MTKHILVVDDHAMMRDGIRAIFRGTPSLRIVAEASEGAEAVDKALDLRPDIILMDISMPSMDGLEASHRILTNDPSAKILILSKHDTPGYVLSAIEAGAAGYVPKTATSNELLSAVAAIARGDSFLHHSIAAVVLDAFRDQKVRKRPMTETDKKILDLIAQSHTSKEIGQLLSISEKTVAARRARMMNRLGEHSVTGLVKFALRTGTPGLGG